MGYYAYKLRLPCDRLSSPIHGVDLLYHARYPGQLE